MTVLQFKQRKSIMDEFKILENAKPVDTRDGKIILELPSGIRGTYLQFVEEARSGVFNG